jgi:hypothetical protein
MAKKGDQSGSRHLILIDVENIAGVPCPSSLDVSFVEARLRATIEGFDQAECIVASSHRSAVPIGLAFPRARRLWRSGTDGADHALIDEMRDLRVMCRFSRVTLCSGDGIFAKSLADLAAAEVETTVVSVADRLSPRLRMAAGRIVVLSPCDNTSPITAPKGV